MRNVPEISIDTVLAILDALPSFKDKTFYSLLAASGRPMGAALRLNLDDVDIEARKVRFPRPERQELPMLHINSRPSQRGKPVPEAGSGLEEILIEPFAKYFFDSLSKYLQNEYERDAQGGAFLLFPRASNGATGGPNYRGGGWPNSKTFRDAVRTAGFECLLTNFRLNAFRRLYCVQAFFSQSSQGGHPNDFLAQFPHSPIEAISQHLKHTSVMTTRLYVSSGPTDENQQAREERIRKSQDALVDRIPQHLKLDDKAANK